MAKSVGEAPLAANSKARAELLVLLLLDVLPPLFQDSFCAILSLLDAHTKTMKEDSVY